MGGGGGFGGGGGGVQGGTDTGGAGGFGGGGGAADGDGGFGGGMGTDGATPAGGGGAGMGGAIFNMQGQLTITNSTLAANEAIAGTDNVPEGPSALGGAVFNLNGGFTATDSTFAANTAANDGRSIYNLVYDAHVARAAQTTLQDTIAADGTGVMAIVQTDVVSNKPANVGGEPANMTAATNNSGGTANVDVSQFDLVPHTAQRGGGTITGSPLTADPLLGPLEPNGGPTPTMGLQPGSPAIDAGDSFGLSTDQRGDPRPVDFSGIPNAAGGDGADIGAFEVQQSCIDQAVPAQACLPLSVSLAGSGTGAVSGLGISCPGNCSGAYGNATTVTLIATPAAGSTFSGWSGDCSGTGACTLTMGGPHNVTATFTPTPIPTPTPASALASPIVGHTGVSASATSTPTQASAVPTPIVGHASETHSTFRAGNGLATLAKKHPPTIALGTTFSFTLNESAKVSLTFTRHTQGRTVHGRCLAPTPHNRRRPTCRRTQTAGTLSFTGHAGLDKVSFQGRITPSNKLGPGRYTLTITATAAAKASAPVHLNFTIIKK